MSKRYVLDTNLVVSAVLYKRSRSRQAFEAARSTGDILQSNETTVELYDVLKRPKFDKYLPEAERLEFLSLLLHHAVRVEIITNIAVCRDPKDNKFLELAVDGEADLLISGDQDLLILNPFQEITIITPSAFLDMK
jgi:putative PIN family toxin of toxin-antitoxin system